MRGPNRVPGPLDIDAVETYLAAHNPVAPPAVGRVNTVVTR